MKKFVIILIMIGLFGSPQVFAKGIDFQLNKSWAEVLKMAKSQNKFIFLDANAVWCIHCKELKNNVFPNSVVGDFFNQHFINVSIDIEKGEGIAIAKKYKITLLPSLFFFDGNGNVISKIEGAPGVQQFLQSGYDVVNPDKKYLALREKAEANKLKPDELLFWVKEAEGVSDGDRYPVIKNYLSLPECQQWNKDLLDIVLYHADPLNEGQLAKLQQNSADFARMEDIDPIAFDALVTAKMDSFAYYKSLMVNKNDPRYSTFDINTFKSLIKRLKPKSVNIEILKISVNFFNRAQQYNKAVDELLICMDGSFKIGAPDLYFLLKGNSNIVSATMRGDELARKLTAYSLSPEEAKLDYYFELSLMVIYGEMDNKSQMKQWAEKALNNPNTPQSVKDQTMAALSENGV